MNIAEDTYTITSLSKQLKLTDHALRYYEKEFHLKIDRDDRGRRYYTPENANLMYTIKKMRDEGIGIKAIKKILQSKNLIPSTEDSNLEYPVQSYSSPSYNIADVRSIFDNFKSELSQNIDIEFQTIREYLTNEIRQTRDEISSSLDTNSEKIEYKMEKHFQEVDKAINSWRSKRKKSIFERLFPKTIAK